MAETPFKFTVALEAFEKAGAPVGKQRRIGGVATLETRDQQDEVVLARGLNWSYFLKNGWFNNNHGKEPQDVLGYPEDARLFKKGTELPNGKRADADGWWVEGYLLGTKKAAETWDLARSLAQTPRRLGFSVEGKVLSREGPGNRTITQALVRHVAITHVPVNDKATLEVLTKSLRGLDLPESAEEEQELERALALGAVNPANPGPLPAGSQPGPTAGRLLSPRSLEGDPRRGKKKTPPHVLDVPAATFSKSEAWQWVRARLPEATDAQIGRVLNLAQLQKGCATEGLMAKKALDAAKKSKKAEDEQEPAGGKPEPDEGDEEEEEEADEKSLDLSTDDLERSLSALESAAQADQPTRKQVLLEKAGKSGLSKAETDELHEILGGRLADRDTPLGEELTRGMRESGTLQKSLDASEFLQDWQAEMVKSLEQLGDRVEKSDRASYELNMLLAKGMVELGRKTVALVKALEQMAAQPASQPRSRGVQPGIRPLVKSQPAADGQPGAESPLGELTKGQVLDAMCTMMEKSMREGRGGLTAAGEDIATATSRFEQFGSMTKTMAGEVQKFIGLGNQG
ncbi:MAG: hypothetical protein WC789_07135 [Lentisphaeria bacterium]